jgi:ABC-type multidrug transport system permease subunit
METMLAMFGTAQPALYAFPQERPVFLREYSTNHYSVISYFLSRLTMEAFITALQILVLVVITHPMIGFRSDFVMLYLNMYVLAMASTAMAVFLGCFVEDPKVGQEMLPLLFVPQMLFSGFFVVPALIPAWLRWARYLCSLTYSIRLAVLEEFGNGCGSEAADNSCNQVIANVDANEEDALWYWLVMVCIFVFFRVLALLVLQKKAVKFF